MPDSNGIMTFPQHWVMLKTWYPLKNLNNQRDIAKTMETGDDSGLSAEELAYYRDIQSFLSGDIITGYGSMKTFGNDMSGIQTIGYYYDNDMFLMNEFTGGPTTTMGQKMSTVTDKVLEYYTKVIMGIETTDNFDSFVEELNGLGLEQITKEVNEWYANK